MTEAGPRGREHGEQHGLRPRRGHRAFDPNGPLIVVSDDEEERRGLFGGWRRMERQPDRGRPRYQRRCTLPETEAAV
jgi:hypothetical protein